MQSYDTTWLARQDHLVAFRTVLMIWNVAFEYSLIVSIVASCTSANILLNLQT